MTKATRRAAFVLAAATCLAARGAPVAGGQGAPPSHTPNEEISRLLLERPEAPVIAPDEEQAGDAAPTGLPAEGMPVVGRRCRLRPEPNSGWLLLVFEDEGDGRPEVAPRRALPSAPLEQMEAYAADHPAAVFRVSGETTVYRGHAYVLLAPAPVVVSPAPAGETSEGPPAPQPVTRPVPGAGRATTRPAGGGEASPTDIFEVLMRDRPARPIDPSAYATSQAAAPASAAPLPPEETLRTAYRGRMVVDRFVQLRAPGQVAKREAGRSGSPGAPGGWWEAHFRGDNTLREPPMRLLPCGLLQQAQAIGGVLRVTGYVTRYKGRTYLLLRKAFRVRNMGQF